MRSLLSLLLLLTTLSLTLLQTTAQFFAKVEAGYFYNGNLIRSDFATEKKTRQVLNDQFRTNSQAIYSTVSNEYKTEDYNTWKDRGSKYLEDGTTEIVENAHLFAHREEKCAPTSPIGMGDATYQKVNEELFLRTDTPPIITEAISDEQVSSEIISNGWTMVQSTGDLHKDSDAPTATPTTFLDHYSLSTHKIIRVVCESCSSLPHQEIFYKRLTPPPSDFLTIFQSDWRTSGNTFNSDFKLYSTYADARSDTNAWTYCGGFNVEGQGFPGTCGPEGAVEGQWMSIPSDADLTLPLTVGQTDVAIFMEDSVNDPLVGPSYNVSAWEVTLEEERMADPTTAMKKGLCWHLPLRDDRAACWRACDYASVSGMTPSDLGALKLCEEYKTKGLYWKVSKQAEALEVTSDVAVSIFDWNEVRAKPTHALGSDVGLPNGGTY